MGRRYNSHMSYGTGTNKQYSIENYELNDRLLEQPKFLRMNIQFFASNFKTPTDPKFIELNEEKQLRHVDKTNGNKSKVTVSIQEARDLVKEFSGRGTMVNNYQEIVDFERVIGYVEVDGKIEETTYGKIHYSKTGSHLVPYRNKKGGMNR